MLKTILNLLLSIVLGKLKPILLKHIEMVDASMINGADKRNAVVASFKKDVLEAGKEIGDSIINLAIEAGVVLLKQKGILK